MDHEAVSTNGQYQEYEQDTIDGSGSMRDRRAYQEPPADSRVVAGRAVWYLAGFIIVMLVLRLVLFLFGANQGAPFVDLVYAVSGLFAAPFTGIFPTPAYGAFALDTASILAIIVYALAAWGISKLFTLNRPSGTAGM